jgi:hypothetical protein
MKAEPLSRNEWNFDNLPENELVALVGRATLCAPLNGWGEATDEPARGDARPTIERAGDCPPHLRQCVNLIVNCHSGRQSAPLRNDPRKKRDAPRPPPPFPQIVSFHAAPDLLEAAPVSHEHPSP